MTRVTSRTIILIIEGVCAEDYEGVAWYYGEKPPGYLTDYLWVRDLTSVPKTISEDCVPLTGQIRSSLGDFDITRTPESVRLLMGRNATTAVAVQSTYTPGDASIVLDTEDLDAGLIWIDDECLEIGTETSAKTYTVVEDALAETDPQIHPAGTLVWFKNWYLFRRRYRLVEYDFDNPSAPLTIARGVIESMSASATVITLGTVSLPSLISGAKLNKNAKRYQAFGRYDETQDRWYGEANLISSVHRDPQAAGTLSTIQAAGTIAQGIPVIIDGFVVVDWAVTGAGSKNMPMACPRIEAEEGIVDDKSAHELFVVTPVKARSSSRDLEDDLPTIPGAWRNRLALAYGFLRCGRGFEDGDWDRWASSWGVGLRETDFDQNAIVAEIIKNSADVDQLILGWDGQEVSVEDLICNILLLPGGYHLATKQDGRIYFAALRFPNLTDLANAPKATAIPQTLGEDYVVGDQLTSVVADVGGLPWKEPDRIKIDIVTGQRTDASRNSAYETFSQFAVNFETVARPIEDVVPDVLERLSMAARNLPRIDIRVLRDTAITYDLGRWYEIDVPVENWWAINGEIVPSPTKQQRLGYLVSRKYNIENGTYNLTFLSHKDDGRIARFRAPAGLVTSAGTSTTIPLAIGHGFVAGETVSVCTSSGVVTVNKRIVSSVTSTSIVVTASTTFTATSVVRLVQFSAYETTPRNWAYIGGLDNQIDDLEPADIYG
jgi:hypothetical protein